MFVEECELATDKNDQEYIKLVLEVLDGEKKGRKLFENLRLDSEYEGVKKQSEAVLKKLCEAKGIDSLGGPRDLAKFIGLELDVKIGLFTTKKGEQKNAINGMRNVSYLSGNMIVSDKNVFLFCPQNVFLISPVGAIRTST